MNKIAWAEQITATRRKAAALMGCDPQSSRRAVPLNEARAADL